MKYQEYKQISMCLLTVLIKDINNSFHQIIDEIVCPPPPILCQHTSARLTLLLLNMVIRDHIFVWLFKTFVY